MKAKLFIIAAAMELRLQDGQVFNNTKNETREDFTKRVAGDVLEELEVTEVTSKSLEKFKTPQLLDAYAKEDPKSVYARMIATLLSSRGVKAEAAPAKGKDTTAADAAKEAKAKEAAEKKEAKEKERAEKKEAAEKKKAEKAAAKAEKVPFAGHSEEMVEAARKNIGHIATFNPFPVDGREAIVEGVIRGIVQDKRVSRWYYRAYDAAGKLYYVQITNATLKIGAVAPEDPAKVKAREEKEEAAKAKAEAKETASKEKAEKAEAAAKAKAEKDAAKVKPAAETTEAKHSITDATTEAKGINKFKAKK